ncbi:peptidase domain-containing ABC transporter [Anaeromusa acidaminophila]|uniref:peptidase domain-containing ABC transporter n=1 Tax=Anaeromusa acidaminophila TaxID=81464 RepID=UPI00037706B4|nr:type I secretion system permease/ATPase [Anaeromusa acidaminophila]
MGEERIDEGLLCLVKAAQMLGVPADYQQLQRAYAVGPEGMDWSTQVRAAKSLGLKAKLIQMCEAPGDYSPATPAVVEISEGHAGLLLQINGDKAWLAIPGEPQTRVLMWPEFKEKLTGHILLLGRAGEQKEAAKFDFSWFSSVLKQYRRQFFAVVGLSLALQGFGLVMPMFTQVIIDKVLVHHSLQTLDVLMIAMIFATVFQSIFSYFRSWIVVHAGSAIDAALSNRLISHLLQLPLAYFERVQAGDIVGRVRELETVRRFLTGVSVMTGVDVLFALVYFGVLFYYSVTLSLLVLAALPVFLVLNLVAVPLFQRALNERFEQGTQMQSFLIEQVTGIETVKTMAVEPLVHRKWEELLTRFNKASFRLNHLTNVVGSLSQFLQMVLNLLILWFGAQAVMADKMSVGELVAFQMIAALAIGPVVRLLGMWQQFQQISVSMNKLKDILGAEREPAFNPNRTTLKQVRGEICFRGVSFRYQEQAPLILRQVSALIPAGKCVGIVGLSGSGKSTLAKLVQRLYVPEAGQVLVDGMDLAQVEPSWLRRQIGVVTQESELFQGTIRENIRIVHPWASDGDVENAARLAGAHDFITDLAQGYETLVGERGSALSGGQRQRIAVARALLTDPRVLIFDEATSALDYESEYILMKNLNQIAQNRTLILIAHRLATIKRCDSILVMHRGQIVEKGTHDELLNKKGAYAKMWD